jgi:hypothetical protein
MKMKAKVAVSIRRSELREREVRVEQTDHALGSVRNDHLLDLGEGAHDDLHDAES